VRQKRVQKKKEKRNRDKKRVKKRREEDSHTEKKWRLLVSRRSSLLLIYLEVIFLFLFAMLLALGNAYNCVYEGYLQYWHTVPLHITNLQFYHYLLCFQRMLWGNEVHIQTFETLFIVGFELWQHYWFYLDHTSYQSKNGVTYKTKCYKVYRVKGYKNTDNWSRHCKTVTNILVVVCEYWCMYRCHVKNCPHILFEVTRIHGHTCNTRQAYNLPGICWG